MFPSQPCDFILDLFPVPPLVLYKYKIVQTEVLFLPGQDTTPHTTVRVILLILWSSVDSAGWLRLRALA